MGSHVHCGPGPLVSHWHRILCRKASMCLHPSFLYVWASDCLVVQWWGSFGLSFLGLHRIPKQQTGLSQSPAPVPSWPVCDLIKELPIEFLSVAWCWFSHNHSSVASGAAFRATGYVLPLVWEVSVWKFIKEDPFMVTNFNEPYTQGA